MHLQNVCLITVITLVLVSEINLEAHEQAGRQADKELFPKYSVIHRMDIVESIAS